MSMFNKICICNKKCYMYIPCMCTHVICIIYMHMGIKPCRGTALRNRWKWAPNFSEEYIIRFFRHKHRLSFGENELLTFPRTIYSTLFVTIIDCFNTETPGRRRRALLQSLEDPAPHTKTGNALLSAPRMAKTSLSSQPPSMLHNRCTGNRCNSIRHSA